MSTKTLPTGMLLAATNYKNKRNGFTLIELVAIVGVMGLMLLIVVPSLQNFGDQSKVSATARNLSGMITQMRQSSITSGRKAWMIYDLSEDTVRPALQDEEGGLTWLTPTTMPPEVTISRVISTEADNDKEITFYPTGLVESHTIELESDSLFITLEVNAITGTVKITRSNKDDSW